MQNLNTPRRALQFAGNKSYDKVRANPEFFVVKHYAGNVGYDSAGFLEKNKDSMSEDLVALFAKSRMGFLRDLFPAEGKDGSSHAIKVSVATQFSKQLTDLMATLNATKPHYIRCIKPNPNKSSEEFNPNMVLEQLRYSGVFEAVQIRKSGFTFRFSHENFYKQFRVCAPELLKNVAKNSRGYKDACRQLIEAMGLSATEIQVCAVARVNQQHQSNSLPL